jgi:hypothetical protein
MSDQPKRGSGRPRGIRFPRQFTVYETDRGYELLEAIARHWDTSNAETIRRLIREKAKELGLTDGAE